MIYLCAGLLSIGIIIGLGIADFSRETSNKSIKKGTSSASTNEQMASALDDIRAVIFGRGDSVTKVMRVQDLITRLNTTKV